MGWDGVNEVNWAGLGPIGVEKWVLGAAFWRMKRIAFFFAADGLKGLGVLEILRPELDIEAEAVLAERSAPFWP